MPIKLEGGGGGAMDGKYVFSSPFFFEYIHCGINVPCYSRIQGGALVGGTSTSYCINNYGFPSSFLQCVLGVERGEKIEIFIFQRGIHKLGRFMQPRNEKNCKTRFPKLATSCTLDCV